MTELADVQDLGSCAARREGSSPFFRSGKVPVLGRFFLFVLRLCCIVLKSEEQQIRGFFLTQTVNDSKIDLEQ